MKPVISIMIFLVVFAPSLVVGQEGVTEEDVFSDYLNVRQPDNFLNIPGLDFRSTMGFSLYSADNSESYGTGFYVGHFDLGISKSLTLHWDVGVYSMLKGEQAGETSQIFLPDIGLTYRPSRNFTLQLQYRQYRQPMAMRWFGY